MFEILSVDSYVHTDQSFSAHVINFTRSVGTVYNREDPGLDAKAKLVIPART